MSLIVDTFKWCCRVGEGRGVWRATSQAEEVSEHRMLVSLTGCLHCLVLAELPTFHNSPPSCSLQAHLQKILKGMGVGFCVCEGSHFVGVSTLTWERELERLCTGKHKGCPKLGVKCCYRNLSFLQSNFFHVNSVLLWQYSILMPSSFFISCNLSALKSESSSDCVFHMFNCWSIKFLQITYMQTRHFIVWLSLSQVTHLAMLS